MRTIEDMRAERVKAINAQIMPIGMRIIGCSFVIAFAVNWLRDKPNLDRIALSVTIAFSLAMILSVLMKRVASAGRVDATGAVGLLFAIMVSTHLSVVAGLNHNGAVQALPLSVIAAVGGVALWPRPWHFALGLPGVLGPPLVLLFTGDTTNETRYIFSQLAFITAAVCIIYFMLVQRSNHRIYAMAMELDYRATHDGLTGLYNRTAWFQQAEKLIAQNRDSVSLLFADIDHFKRLNDRRGHTAGDALLREVARILRESGAGQDLIGRFGGDEFVLLLPHSSSAEAASRATRIEAALAEYSDLPTVSIGIAEWQLDETLDNLIHRADEAMFEKKASRIGV